MYGVDAGARHCRAGDHEATSFRFDGSDLMPGEVGAGSFWKGMTDYVCGAADLDTVLAEIDASWPEGVGWTGIGPAAAAAETARVRRCRADSWSRRWQVSTPARR